MKAEKNMANHTAQLATRPRGLIRNLTVPAPVRRAKSIHAGLRAFPPQTSKVWRSRSELQCQRARIARWLRCGKALTGAERRAPSPVVVLDAGDPERVVPESGKKTAHPHAAPPDQA